MKNYNSPENFKTSQEKYVRYEWEEIYKYRPIGFIGDCPRDVLQSKLQPVEKLVVYIDINGVSCSVSAKLSDIVFSIDQSKAILELEEDWNGDNAERILPETWRKAAVFLMNYSKYILENFSTIIKSPEINPCMNGSIDLVWRTKAARLLINVKPAGNPIIASYYGDLYNNRQAIKSTIEDETVIEHLAFWMKNLA